MSTTTPMLIAPRLRSRRSAAVAGVAFAVLLIIAIVMMRLATAEADLQTLASDVQRRSQIALSLQIVPFAGVAFLWFIGVVRDQLGEVEDRLFSTVFLGSGLLFLAMLFQGAVTETGMLAMLAEEQADAGVWAFGRTTTQALISVYAMRMGAVFTLSVSSVALRTRAVPTVGRPPRLCRRSPPADHRRHEPMGAAGLPELGPSPQRRYPRDPATQPPARRVARRPRARAGATAGGRGQRFQATESSWSSRCWRWLSPRRRGA